MTFGCIDLYPAPVNLMNTSFRQEVINVGASKFQAKNNSPNFPWNISGL
jgi:hypothetical protein